MLSVIWLRSNEFGEVPEIFPPELLIISSTSSGLISSQESSDKTRIKSRDYFAGVLIFLAGRFIRFDQFGYQTKYPKSLSQGKYSLHLHQTLNNQYLFRSLTNIYLNKFQLFFKTQLPSSQQSTQSHHVNKRQKWQNYRYI